MDRMTFKNIGRNGFCWNILLPNYSVQEVIDRLAAYEDTGLAPEAIEALKVRALMGALESPEMEEYSGSALQRADRLIAEYESLGGINHLREFAQAEKDGRLVVLPCKTGDEVWTNFAMSGWYFKGKDRPYSAKVVFVGLNNSGDMGGGFINVMYGKYNYIMQFNFSEIGKTFFLTREEAEAALKKREADNEAVR